MVRYQCLCCGWLGEYESTIWGWHDVDLCPQCGNAVTPLIHDPEYGDFNAFD